MCIFKGTGLFWENTHSLLAVVENYHTIFFLPPTPDRSLFAAHRTHALHHTDTAADKTDHDGLSAHLYHSPGLHSN